VVATGARPGRSCGVERFSKSAAATFVAILVCRDFHKIFLIFFLWLILEFRGRQGSQMGWVNNALTIPNVFKLSIENIIDKGTDHFVTIQKRYILSNNVYNIVLP